jgi:hypothetical protein
MIQKVRTPLISTTSITGNLVASGAIAGNNIVEGQITGNLIADGAIAGNNIVAGTITGNLIANNAVSGNNIVSPPDIFDDVFLFGGM